MSLGRYLISIESRDSLRFKNFFLKNKFKESDFIIYGVVGKKIPTQEYFNRAVLSARYPLTPSELGCKESHLACMRDFLKSSCDYALVLEDDVFCKFDFDFDFDFSKFGRNFLLFMGDFSNKKNKKYYGWKKDFKFLSQDVWSIHYYFLSSVFGAYAYIVDRECAEKYVKYLDHPNVSDDWMVFVRDYNRQMNFYIVDGFYHPDVGSDDFSSNIEDERSRRNLARTELERKQKNPFVFNKKLWRLGRLFLRLFLHRYKI